MNDSNTLGSWLFEKKPWSNEIEAALAEGGFEQPESAWRILSSISKQSNFAQLYPQFFSEFFKSLSQSYNPDIALNNFQRLTEDILDKDNLYSQLSASPYLLNALTLLFSGSQMLTDALLSNPSYVDWLSDPETLTKPKTRDVLYRDFYKMAGTDELTDGIPSFLRKFKKREYIRRPLKPCF